MKRPFPVKRRGTVTRANVGRVLREHPGLDTPGKLADHLCGVGECGNSHAKARHVGRCRKLMRAAAPDPAPKEAS